VSAFSGFLEASVRGATPLAFAAAGALCSERSGIMNLGLEGMMAIGAFVAFIAAISSGPAEALLAGALAGMVVAACFAAFVLLVRAQQVLAGMAISMLGVGLAATFHRAWLAHGHAESPLATLPVVSVPVLSRIPGVGPAFFSQPWPTYVLYALFPLIGWVLFRTTFGLIARASDAAPDAVRASGHNPRRVQAASLLASGFLAGLGGATLVVTQTGAFSDAMTAGRGYIAIAIVALGRRHPGGVALASLLFGGVSAVQFLGQSLAWQVPYGLMLMVPYVATLAALAVSRGSRYRPG
jgi:simple sugar transport system permease protein